MTIGAYIGLSMVAAWAGFIVFLWVDHFRFWRQFGYYRGEQLAHPIWAASQRKKRRKR